MSNIRCIIAHFPLVDDFSFFTVFPSSSPVTSSFLASSSSATADSTMSASYSSPSGLEIFDLSDDFVENANLDCLGGAVVPFGLLKNFLNKKYVRMNSN